MVWDLDFAERSEDHEYAEHLWCEPLAFSVISTAQSLVSCRREVNRLRGKQWTTAVAFRHFATLMELLWSSKGSELTKVLRTEGAKAVS